MNLRLPRKVEDDPAAHNLGRELAARARLLWSGAQLSASQVELSPGIASALESAYASGRIVRGLEGAERALAGEEAGLARVDQKTGVKRGARVSRVLVLADDGAERFYRNVESLLRRHAPRVLALRLSVDEHELGRLIFGPEQVARLVLVEHKDAVAALLLAVAEQWSGDDPNTR